jgi:hypothetical protein
MSGRCDGDQWLVVASGSWSRIAAECVCIVRHGKRWLAANRERAVLACSLWPGSVLVQYGGDYLVAVSRYLYDGAGMDLDAG